MPWVEPLPSGKWRGGYMDQYGRKQQLGGFTLRKQALLWAQDGEDAARQGETYTARAGRTLFREFAERWQAARLVEQSTAGSERSRYKVIVDRWGDTPIGAIGVLELQRWVKELERSGRQAGTVRKYHGLMSSILTAATLPPDRLIAENPARHVRLPKLPRGREVYLTREQVDSLDVELVDRDAHRTLTWLLAHTGARWGEGAGLHLDRIDWLRRTVTVADVLGQHKGGFHWKEYTKGDGQRWTPLRIVPIPDHVVDRLAAHVKNHPPVDCGLHKDCSGLLFWTRRHGKEPYPLRRETYNHYVFTPAAIRAGLGSKVRPHDLRHTYASWIIGAGVPMREAQYLLGHASMSTTERYSHFQPGSGDAVRTALDRGNPAWENHAHTAPPSG